TTSTIVRRMRSDGVSDLRPRTRYKLATMPEAVNPLAIAKIATQKSPMSASVRIRGIAWAVPIFSAEFVPKRIIGFIWPAIWSNFRPPQVGIFRAYNPETEHDRPAIS